MLSVPVEGAYYELMGQALAGSALGAVVWQSYR